ncbi:undecaprenyl-diphosphatase UppP [Candidatus Uabimicrobium amorphum]|uniref:Undecaprenyl-diphosphatase n=1 Tax=Uabimicrobium amorphum TaxID=2596890 RepID=A0A5S9ISN9_UABAM|nr:undecaprenyl-diphosphatase UppP [Candidatus Uabimicrobium amorphum]BBM86830.1 undecaprenyl-diphosphatase [Candidatus Uabimicrobium amorphum]
MDYFEILILGIVQGVGEFLPISSSGHLVLTPWLFGFNDSGLAFDVTLHLGTLLAVMIYFHRQWLCLVCDPVRYVLQKSYRTPESKQSCILLLCLVVASIPAAIAGLLLKDTIETTFRSPVTIAINLIVFGMALVYADKTGRKTREFETIGLKTAFAIGCSQALALFPGVSRSGITIAAALLLGFNRKSAAQFSFLISAPIIVGACVLNYSHLLTAFANLQILFGFLVAVISGLLSIKYLLQYVQKYDYNIFCYYRFFLGTTILWLLFSKFS